MPFHVRVSSQSKPNDDEVKLDIDEQELRSRFLGPYEAGRPIVIGGRTIPPTDLARIRINWTDESSDALLPIVRADLRRSGLITLIPDAWYVADKGDEVTDTYITGPPGSAAGIRTEAVSASAGTKDSSPPDARSVLVVHGRNRMARDAMFTFLRALGLHPLEWSEAVLATGRPSPYVGEVLTKAFELAGAVVVVMTPDDRAVLREEFREAGDPGHETELTGQARPNVLFEAGLAMGRDEDRTVLVEIGAVRPFSDLAGRQ